MRIVITGASGYVGRQLVIALSNRGFELLLVGRNQQKLNTLFPDHNTCSYDNFEEYAKGFDALLHLATLNNNTSASYEDCIRVNFDFLKYVLELCKSSKIGLFIYLGSTHSISAATPYSLSKLKAENFLDTQSDVKVTKFILPAVYGTKFSGKLKVLNSVPAPFRTIFLNILRSIKPTLNIDKLSAKIGAIEVDSRPTSEIITDSQKNNPIYAVAKRLLDFVLSFFFLAIFWWFLGLVWLIVKLTSDGSPIFAQTRLGQHQQPFTLYKFRTMVSNTPEAGTHEISANMVTPVGRFLRKSKIDELPQLWNVLRGELSLVGPRPCLPSQMELIAERLKRDVFSIRPGITGYAQIIGVDMSEPIKLAIVDSNYVKLRTLPFDLKIIINTAFGHGKRDGTKKYSDE